MSLKNLQLFGNTPSNFNDPLDSYLLTKALRSDDEMIKDNNSGNSINKARLEQLRITCLSSVIPTDAQSTIMWAHYADNHKGICLEYDIKSILDLITSSYSLSECNDGDVVISPCFYHEEKTLPTLNELGLKSAFYKHSAWSYEKEFRILLKDPCIELKPSTVYVGCRTPQSDKVFIEKLLDELKIKYDDRISETTFGYNINK